MMGKERKTSSRKVARRVKVVEDGHEKKKSRNAIWARKWSEKQKFSCFFSGFPSLGLVFRSSGWRHCVDQVWWIFANIPDLVCCGARQLLRDGETDGEMLEAICRIYLERQAIRPSPPSCAMGYPYLLYLIVSLFFFHRRMLLLPSSYRPVWRLDRVLGNTCVCCVLIWHRSRRKC